MPKSRYRALDEVHLFDQAVSPKSRLYRLRQFIKMVAHATRPLTPKPIQLSRVIPTDGMGSTVIQYRYNLPNLYDLANYTYQRLGRLTHIKLPHPPAIWHATTPLPIRVRGARMVTTIHDLIPLRLPYATLDNKQFFYRLVQDSLRDSDLVLTISENSKQDILSFFDVPEERILVTYQSLPLAQPSIDKMLARALLKSYSLMPGQYVLFVGNIEPKKNLATLIQAASMLQHELPLVVVGRKAWLWEGQLKAAEAYFGSAESARLRILGYVPPIALTALYSNALCLAFPSLYEGFGLPPLEAMRHGCPVICSNAASLPEVCGDAALYADPRDPDALRTHMESLMEDIRLRAHLIEAGFKRVEYFSPERYAERLTAAYGTILN
jgi:glycosyltransferase involved in cell wall biosynthesis